MKSLIIPVEPCLKSDPENGGCDQICTDDGYEAVCECQPGYKLLDDKKTCEKSKWENTLRI